MADPGLSLVMDGGLIALVVTNLGMIAKEIIRWKNGKKNDNGSPGKGATCIEHGKILAVHGSEIQGVKKAIDDMRADIKEDLKEIKDSLNT